MANALQYGNRNARPDLAPYLPSRAAMRERFGARAIDASAPPSSRNVMPGIRADPQTNLTSREGPSDNPMENLKSNWRGLFKPLGMKPAAPSLAPTTPPDAMSMAMAAQDADLNAAGYSTVPPKIEPPKPESHLDSAIAQSTQWLRSSGATVPPPPPQPKLFKPLSTTSITTPYGTGSVHYGEKLKRLAGYRGADFGV